MTLDGQTTTIAAVPSSVHRMRDLVRLTGVSAPTIHFYAQQGLLPPARKTAGNQALYSDSTITRIRWIRDLQTELNLSLRSIAHVLEMRGELAVEEIRALQALGALLDEPDPAAGTAELAAVRERLAPTDIASLQRLGLIGSTGPISSSDLRLLDLVAAMRASGFTEEAGFSIESLALYRDAVERLVADELARIVEPVLHRHDPETLRDLVHRGLPLTDRLLSLLHQRAVRGEMQRWLDIAPDAAGATA
ncbi:MAG: MerR family transcriptional regulator [Candidatus Dormibacteraeota bacterium]|nr:MerR family transcriptional regulator [Candidatus Dormibacteraeota bacterium]